MSKSMVLGVVLGAAAATAVGTIAGYRAYVADDAPQFAEVMSVNAVNESYTVPREVCEQREVTKVVPKKDENQLAGTALGAVAGGLLGNQVGGGSGKKIATVVGAVAGGYAGKKVQEDMQNKDTYTEIETHCSTVNDKKQRVIGYDVEYKIADQVAVVRMDKKPESNQLPLKDGKLDLSQLQSGTAQ
ncbi:glycine zipper 2TM domain-containing protein [Neptuniibacter sp. CAU 1671]|uniref:glycine zipper 2TM domain-containing protein n=1 Tax=Neptuniibacter sp. CAU 1671 TaxID=3032593 RepID=UPI0023DB49C8|nr:glycine zipper 2TM domain-containing protein [Neptuniibacter sp. CAU 1671]MDF2180503.1 glycine zipper 2TM domain-containing protein [Neptuniibacter sp. CAU 1671]